MCIYDADARTQAQHLENMRQTHTKIDVGMCVDGTCHTAGVCVSGGKTAFSFIHNVV